MENNIEHSAINREQPLSQQPITPIPQPKDKLKIIVIIVVILLAIYGGIYYFVINRIDNYINRTQRSASIFTSKNLTPTPIPASPTFTSTLSQISPILKPQNIQSEIVTTVPQNVNKFIKSVISEDHCNNPVGMVRYCDKFAGCMKINNIKLQKNKMSKESLLAIDNFLTNNTITAYQDIGFILGAFHDDCGGYYMKYVKDLPNIPYPNTDKARVIISYYGQEDFGSTELDVLARRGDDIIYLVSRPNWGSGLDWGVTLKSKLDMCESENNENCYEKAILNDKAFEAAAINTAKNLINLFSIEASN